MLYLQVYFVIHFQNISNKIFIHASQGFFKQGKKSGSGDMTHPDGKVEFGYCIDDVCVGKNAVLK